MINLFTINESYEVELNKEWIGLIPAFSAVIKADKGSKGDSDGRKKLLARRQLAYVYFMVDFRSPIFSYEEGKKHQEALRYVGLGDLDVMSPVVNEAKKEYAAIQLEQARTLKTLAAAYKGMDALDKYLNEVDFDKTDKQGKLLHSPKEFVSNLKELNNAYDQIDKFEKRVHKELQESNATIRGTADLGDKEKMKNEKTKVWEEGTDESVAFTAATARSFSDLGVHMNKVKQRPKAVFEAEEDEDDA